MKHTFTLSILLLLCCVVGCKKDTTISGPAMKPNLFYESGIEYLKTNLNSSDFQRLDLTRHKIFTRNDNDHVLQIFEKGNNGNRFLLLHLQNSNYSGNWIDLSNLVKQDSRYAKGTIILSSIDNNIITVLYVDSNKVIQSLKTFGNNFSLSQNFSNHKSKSFNPNGTITPDLADPTLPTVYIYMPPDDDTPAVDYYSWYWLIDQVTVGGTYTYFTTASDGNMGAGSTGNVSNVPIINAPDAPIADLKKELKCFTNNNSATYNVSINVNQPDPGTRDIVNPLSSHPVGHTFLTLEQHDPDGTSIVRSVGFYPTDMVMPGDEKSPSVFGDDNSTPFCVSLSITVSGSQMQTLVNALLAQQAYQYDLENFNCTTSAIYALKSININLPETKSYQSLFNGDNPGDLGQDIRQLNLDDFSAKNGGEKMKRTTSNSNNQYADGKTGSCP